MKVAKVIGNIWATRKEEKLAGYKLLIVQPINILDGSKDKTPIVAADIIGAGVGETVSTRRMKPSLPAGEHADNTPVSISRPANSCVVFFIVK